MPAEQRQVGPFKLVERLGAGGMGSVYVGVHQDDGKRVAVKLLSSRLSGSKRAVARFNRELDILMKLKHPNIIRCFGGGRYQGQHFLVMELVKGGSLASVLKRRGRLPWETVVEYSLQVCAALEYAHDQGVIHRDLTPGNLLLTDKDQLKIADFGLARVTFGERLTATRHTLGTVAYMSPEQIRGSKHTSHKTDLYALGCDMFEMLTGRLPFTAESTAEMLYQHMEEDPPPVATMALDCPVWLDTLVHQLLEKDADDRPQDAAAVARALREIQQRVQEGEGIAQSTTAGGPSALKTNADSADVVRLIGRRKKRRREGGPFYERAWFLALCIAAIVGFFGWVFWPESEQELATQYYELRDAADASKVKLLGVIEKILSRFPDGDLAADARETRQLFDAEAAEKRVLTKKKSSLVSDPTFTPVETSYLKALDYEDHQDLLSARDHYEAAIKLFSKNKRKAEGDDALLIWMAERKIEKLGDRDKLVESTQKTIDENLEKADELYKSGLETNRDVAIQEAVDIWNGIITIYEENKTFSSQVALAKKKRDEHLRRSARKEPDAEPKAKSE